MKKILRKDLQLETCGETGENYKHIGSHLKGCYIRFSNKIVKYSKPRDDCVVDYDDEGNIIGIEFYDGL